jgi:hypothetical protein
MSFEQELIAFLKKHRIVYDPKYMCLIVELFRTCGALNRSAIVPTTYAPG